MYRNGNNFPRDLYRLKDGANKLSMPMVDVGIGSGFVPVENTLQMVSYCKCRNVRTVYFIYFIIFYSYYFSYHRLFMLYTIST